MPVVSERPTSSAPAAATCAASQTTSSAGTSPCSVQPNAVEIPTSTPTPGATRIAQFDDGTHLVDHLLARPAHVGERMRCASRYRDRDLVHAGIDGGFSTFHVRHQCHHRPIRQRHRVPHDVGGVGHLRQQLRRNERSDLDLAQAGRVQPSIQANLAAVGIVRATLCRPSRGPTSLISTSGVDALFIK